MKMKPKYLIFLFPAIVLADLFIFTSISEFLRDKSDMSVMMGIILACIFVTGNYFLINYIIKTIKNKIK